MFCKNCGKQIPDGSPFCTYCGTKLAASAAPTPAQPAPAQYQPAQTPPGKKKDPKVIVLIVVAAVLLVAVVVLAVALLSAPKAEAPSSAGTIGSLFSSEPEPEPEPSASTFAPPPASSLSEPEPPSSSSEPEPSSSSSAPVYQAPAKVSAAFLSNGTWLAAKPFDDGSYRYFKFYEDGTCRLGWATPGILDSFSTFNTGEWELTLESNSNKYTFSPEG